jgi:tripartite-type tricarboxylate transporter receptor subunit TctC
LHFAAELLKKQAGIFMVHVPYRGVAPLGSDLVGGGIEVAMMSPAGARGLLATGKLTVLGVTSAKRLPAFPQVPSLSEHPALKGYDLNGWFALVGPRGLPTNVNLRLQAALQETLADPSVQKKLEDAGNFVATGKEDLSAMVSAEIKQLQAVAKFANIRE